MVIRDVIELIFASALFINASLFIPQAIKIFREKTATSISLLTFFGFLATQFAVVLHGILHQDYLLAVGYLLSMLTCSAVIVLAIIYKKDSFAHSKINFYEVLNQLPGHIYWKDKEGICLGCNADNWKDFGLNSLADFVGKTDYDLLPYMKADEHRKIDLEIMQTGQSKVIEEEGVAADGKPALYLSSKAPLRNRHNEIIGILGTSLDITEARKEELERLVFLENIIALMPGHVYWVNRDNIYLGCNDNQARSAGLGSRKEIVGKRNKDLPWNFNAGVLPEALDKVNQEVMDAGKAIMVEEPALLCDGTEAIFLSNKSPLRNTQGEIIGMVGVSIDITAERKLRERELEETRHKFEGMTLVGAAIAHELRTPLSAFSMATDNIKVAYPQLKQAYLWAKEQQAPIGRLSNNYLDYLEETLNSMQREIESAATFIDIMLINTNPSLDMGKPEVLSISEVIDHALSRYPFNQGQKELVQWSSAQDQDFLVKGDRLLLTHVLFNLIKNALYYMAKVGKGKIEIKLEAEQRRLYFKDTGSGIASEILPYIFQRFFSTTDKSAHPAGVGLSFCQQVMESLQGDITCESVENEYTLFILSFPNLVHTTEGEIWSKLS